MSDRLLSDVGHDHDHGQIPVSYARAGKDGDADGGILSQNTRQFTRKTVWYFLWFLIGAAVCGLIIFLAHHHRGGSSSSDDRPSWSAADYKENWQHYADVDPHPITIEDNMRLSRIGEVTLSPDGQIAVFTRTQIDQEHANRTATSLWYYNLPYTDGYSANPLTRPVWGVHDSQPAFDAYARTVFFLSNRDSSAMSVGSSQQIWQVELPTARSTRSSTINQPVAYSAGAAINAGRKLMGKETAEERAQYQPKPRPQFRPLGAISQPQPLSAAERQSLQRRFTQRVHDDTPNADSSSLPDASSAHYATPRQLTSFPVSVDHLMVGFTTTTRSILAFSCGVYPSLSMAQTAARKAEIASRGGDSHLYDKIYVRHWDEWRDGTRQHIHLMSVLQNDDAAVIQMSEPVDIMLNVDSDAPTVPDGDAASEWSFNFDSTNFAYTRQTWDPYANVTWNTNLDIYTVAIPASAATAPVFPSPLVSVCRTCDNIATDTSPAYSPLSRDTFVYRSTSVPGYESDRYRVKLIWNASTPPIDLTAEWTLGVDSVAWSAASTDRMGLYVTVSANARQQVLRVDIRNSSTYDVLVSEGSSGGIVVGPSDSFFLFSQSSYDQPANLYVYHNDAANPADAVQELTTGFNALALSKMQRSATQEFHFIGANADQIQGFLFTPVNFDPAKKYPMAFLIHGGPQSPWASSWSYRWNPQIYAAAGFVTVMINFHGSPGWGQNFTDSITGRYGSWPYEDLMAGLKYLIESSPWAANIDSDRLAALGASYGGYMINWINGHNVNQEYKFRVFVCHDGMFDIRSFYYSTEELFFPEHDQPGLPWMQPDHYERFNPAQPDLIAQWNTPTLIIHGELDYRIAISQGLSAFTALQRRGIPSQFLLFPKEAHQVFNTRNQITWHHTVLKWITRYTDTEEEQANNLQSTPQTTRREL